MDEAMAPLVVRQWARAWNEGDSAAMAGLFAAEGFYIDRAFQVRSDGAAAIADWVALTVRHIPDAQVELIDAFAAADDRAVARWTFSGTFSAEHPFGQDADIAGRSFTTPAVSWFAVRGERLLSVEDFYERSDIIAQLGLPLGPHDPRRAR